MSGIRALEHGLVLPDGDDPPGRPRALSYDFSRWNEAQDEEADAADPPDVSFRVYTPDAIKAQPIRRTPLPPPPADDGIRDLGEALEVARSIGGGELLARFGVGAAAGLLILFALAGFALLADDRSEGRGILAASTETPGAAAFMPSLATIPAPVATAEPAAVASDETYFELPDQAATPKPKRAARTGSDRTGKTGKALVRDTPF
jgi:hypothetical protein